MTAGEVLDRLWQKGLRAWMHSDNKAVQVRPAALLTDEDRALIRGHIDGIRALLVADEMEWRQEREGILIHNAGYPAHKAAVMAAEMWRQMKEREDKAPRGRR